MTYAQMHQNSLFQWRKEVRPTLTKRQEEVLNVYKTGDYTDEEVSIKLGYPINRISGRVGELIRLEKLRELSKDETKIRGRRVCTLI